MIQNLDIFTCDENTFDDIMQHIIFNVKPLLLTKNDIQQWNVLEKRIKNFCWKQRDKKFSYFDLFEIVCDEFDIKPPSIIRYTSELYDILSNDVQHVLNLTNTDDIIVFRWNAVEFAYELCMFDELTNDYIQLHNLLFTCSLEEK